MKKYLLGLLLLLVSVALMAQPKQVDDLISEGMRLHDQGAFKAAIDKYEAALKISPTHPKANYEMALSHFSVGSYDVSIRYSNMTLRSPSPYRKGAYLVKGSALDNLGRTQEAIEVYEEGIRQFPSYYLLHYNLGLSCFNGNLLRQAEQAVISAIKANPNHPSSHLLMAYIMRDQQKRAQAVMPLYYFLMLEPRSSRAAQAYDLLRTLMREGVNQEFPKQVNINLNVEEVGADFRAIEVALALIEASNGLDENVRKSEAVKFSESTVSFFEVLGEKRGAKATGFWWHVYGDFFAGMAKAGYARTFAYYVSQSRFQSEIDIWLEDHAQELQDLVKWVEKYE